MKKLCSLLVLLCCLAVQPLTIGATTWVKLYDLGYEGSVAVDADSFSYNREKGLVYLWQRVESAADGSVLELEYSYNLREETAALLGERFQQPGETATYQKYAQISYQPISQGSYEENIRYFLRLISFLEDNNIAWEFNMREIPHPSSLEGSDWEMPTEGLVYDTATAYSDDQQESYWTSRENVLDYILVSKTEQRLAVLAQLFLQNGEIVLGFNYPIIIWSQTGGQFTEAHNQAMQAQTVILNGIFESYASLYEE